MPAWEICDQFGQKFCFLIFATSLNIQPKIYQNITVAQKIAFNHQKNYRKMGKNKKKSKKEKKHKEKADKEHRDRSDDRGGNNDSAAISKEPTYGIVEAHLIRVGNTDATHEIDETMYHKLDDSIDEKEKEKLRR